MKPKTGRHGQEAKYRMITSLLSVRNVELSFQEKVEWWHITDPNMKESSFLVISVIIKLHNRFIFRLIFGLNMKVSVQGA